MKNIIIILVLLYINLSFGYVGQTYTEILKENHHIKILSVDKNSTPHAKRAIEIEKYGFIIYALFDKNDICYEEYTLKNKTLPNPSLLLGKASENASKKLIFRAPLRMAVWEYYINGHTIIYQTFGLVGDLSVDARLVK